MFTINISNTILENWPVIMDYGKINPEMELILSDETVQICM